MKISNISNINIIVSTSDNLGSNNGVTEYVNKYILLFTLSDFSIFLLLFINLSTEG